MHQSPNTPDLMSPTPREEVLKKAGPVLVAAVEKLVSQMDSENDTVSQRAAKELIALFETMVMQQDEREIIVRVVDMPPLGIPEAAHTDYANA